MPSLRLITAGEKSDTFTDRPGLPMKGTLKGCKMAIDWQSRRDGFDHRKYKPTDAPINWKYWGSLQDIKQWDACALSLNINPDCLKAKKMAMPGKPEFLDASFPSEAALLEFYERLTMLNRETQGRYLATVNPAQFAASCTVRRLVRENRISRLAARTGGNGVTTRTRGTYSARNGHRKACTRGNCERWPCT